MHGASACVQVMLRVKDPHLSVPFYRDYFGMKLVREVSGVAFNFCAHWAVVICC